MMFNLRSAASLLTGSALAGAVLLGAGAQGCSVQVVQGDGGTLFPDSDGGFVEFPDRDSAAPDAGPGLVTDSCSRCLYAQCATFHLNCQTNRECAETYNCALQPGANVDACINARPEGSAAYTGLYTCDQRQACTTCATECAANPIKQRCDRWVAPSGGDSDAGPVFTDAGAQGQTCDRCVADQCASEKAECGAGTECEAYSSCVSQCVSGAPDKLDLCFDACSSAYPDGRAKGDALSSCTSANCRTECF